MFEAIMKAQQNNNQPKSNADDDKDHLRKLFIGGLSAITTEDSLKAFYSKWGEVVDVVVMRDPNTKRSRGFGFITYSDISMVDKAQSDRPHSIDGKAVESKRALPRPELGKNDMTVKKIFVGGLKENHDEQSLKEHFSQFGKVVGVKILTDKTTGRMRGFAFVEFDDYDAVDKAVLHKNHTIKYNLVDVKKSAYKQEYAKKIAGQQQQQQSQQGGGVAGGNISSAGYQQAAASYNPQSGYAYPPHMPPPPAGYGGWGGYAQPVGPGYTQTAQSATATAGYGHFAAPNGAWNTGAYAAAPTNWGPNNYSAGNSTTSVPPTSSTAAANWSASNAPNFGDYQQAYNGGPQKTGSLQGNRMNPYPVAAVPNYAYASGGN